MSMPSTPDHLIRSVKQLEKMNQDLSKMMMPKEMASAINLLSHPLAGSAALSALSIGFASQAFGMWVGAFSAVAESSQRLLQPMLDGFPGSVESFADVKKAPAAKVRATTQTLIAEVQSFAKEKAKVAGSAQDVAKTNVVSLKQARKPVVAPAELKLAVKQPRALAKPQAADDLKAIAGVGPKLEKVLNDLGIWTYAQIAKWTSEEISWVDEHLGFKGRIGRDDWIGQAGKLVSARAGS